MNFEEAKKLLGRATSKEDVEAALKGTADTWYENATGVLVFEFDDGLYVIYSEKDYSQWWL